MLRDIFRDLTEDLEALPEDIKDVAESTGGVLGQFASDADKARDGDEEAVKWYRLSAEQGDAGAQYYLG